MKKEIITTAQTVEAAVAAACADLGVEKEAVTYEVLTEERLSRHGSGRGKGKGRVF